MSLAGKRLQVFIGEFDTKEPPELPPGTIARRLAGPDHDRYWLVQLDTQAECRVWKAAAPWVVHMFVVAPAGMGDSLDRLFATEKHVFVPLTIWKLIEPFDAKVDGFDFSQVEYFTRGYATRIAKSGQEASNIREGRERNRDHGSQ